jgi:hypothetical protein
MNGVANDMINEMAASANNIFKTAFINEDLTISIFYLMGLGCWERGAAWASNPFPFPEIEEHPDGQGEHQRESS